MRQFLRAMWIAICSLGLCVAAPAVAQPKSQTLSQTALDRLSDLQSMAGQLAQQSGKIGGRTVGPQIASATAQLQSVLLNFDVWACGSAVTALALKRDRLVVAAAAADPADPRLDKAVNDFSNLISQLQELCNRFVYDAGLPGAGGQAGGGIAPPPPPALPPPPRLRPQEKICYDRCHRLYEQFAEAQGEYDRAAREAQRARQQASELTRDAAEAAQRARSASQHSDEVKRDFDQQQAAMSAATDQATRLQIAGRLSHLDPNGARRAATDAQKAADEAARTAQQGDVRAARAEAEASALYDAMVEIYQAWERCARSCAEQAKTYDHVDIDVHEVFPDMPNSQPQRPPFYRAFPPPTPTSTSGAATRGQVGMALPAPSCGPPSTALASIVLAVHNPQRASYGAEPLCWSPELAEHAQQYAEQMARTGQLVHASRDGRGIERENLSEGFTWWTPQQLMNSWLREKPNFIPGNFPDVSKTGNWEDVAHFTQMIWPMTREIGCGLAVGNGRSWFDCRYSPGGNKGGKPVGLPTNYVEKVPGMDWASLLLDGSSRRDSLSDFGDGLDEDLAGAGLSGFVGSGAGVARVDLNNIRVFMNQGVVDDEGVAREILSKVAPVYSDTNVEQPPLGPSVIYPPAVIEMLGEPSDWLEPM